MSGPRPKPRHRTKIPTLDPPLRRMGIERADRPNSDIPFEVNPEKEKERRRRTSYAGRRWNKRIRPRILQRDGFTCRMCGLHDRTGEKLEVDHIVEHVDYGSDHEANLQTLCKSCHQRKSRMVATAMGRKWW